MFKFYRFVLIIVFIVTPHVSKCNPCLKEVIEDYRRTLPPVPQRGTSPRDTALRATRFLFSFLDEESVSDINTSLNTIDVNRPTDSLFGCMSFHLYKEGLEFKTARDQRVGQVYQDLLKALENNEPVVSYLYYHAFKSANLFDSNTRKGKVLTRDVDLQERLNYETYRYLQEGLRSLGFNYHFIIVRDTYHLLSLDLGEKDERITKKSGDIKQFGTNLRKISEETGVMTLDLCDLKNVRGETFEQCFVEHLETIIEDGEKIDKAKVTDIKGFLMEEYDYVKASKRAKERDAKARAKRYLSIIDFMRDHDISYSVPSFAKLFGTTRYRIVPISVHLKDHVKSCRKVPLLIIKNFLGGYNSQHQIPLLQQTTGGQTNFYTIRGRELALLMKYMPGMINETKIDGYPTFLYRGDEDLGALIQ